MAIDKVSISQASNIKIDDAKSRQTKEVERKENTGSEQERKSQEIAQDSVTISNSKEAEVLAKGISSALNAQSTNVHKVEKLKADYQEGRLVVDQKAAERAADALIKEEMMRVDNADRNR